VDCGNEKLNPYIEPARTTERKSFAFFTTFYIQKDNRSDALSYCFDGKGTRSRSTFVRHRCWEETSVRFCRSGGSLSGNGRASRSVPRDGSQVHTGAARDRRQKTVSSPFVNRPRRFAKQSGRLSGLYQK